MPRGMLVHEIFSSQSQPAAKKKADNGGMASKKTAAPMPPMKRFGGYKPKILAGEDIAPSNRNEAAFSPSSPTPLPPPTSPPHPRPVLTKPKPFIIGDKDVPMVLGSFGDSDGSSHNDSNINGINNISNMDINSNNTANNDRNSYFDSNINDLNIYDTVEDIGANGVDTDPTDSELDRSEFPRTNGIEIENSNFDSPIFDGTYFDQSVKTNLIDANNRSSSMSDFATENPAFINDTEHETKRLPVPVPIPVPAPIPEPEPEQILHKDNQADDDLKEVHIPEPDYDEKEEMLDFTEEDPDTLPEYNQSNEKKFYTLTPLSSRVYYGEDYSQYLSDDDDDPLKRNFSTNGGEGGGRREVVRRLSEKHSMFKYPANVDVPKHAASKQKGFVKSGHNSNNNNSVRSFSYADSKCGTKGRAKGLTLALKKGGDEAENFNDDSYESFLFSRHGHTMPARIPAVNPVQQGQGGQRGGDDKLWKKLTYRLRNKRNKNGYALSEVA